MKKLNDNNGFGVVEIILTLILIIVLLMIFKAPITYAISRMIILLQNIFIVQ